MVMRRRRAWADTRKAGVLIVASGNITDDLLLGLAAAETKTVTRILLDLWFILPVNNSFADRENVVDIGIGVVSREAFDLGTLPDPGTVADYPQQGWLYLATQVVSRAADATGVIWQHAHFKADIRGQRKVDRGVLFSTLENVGVVGADAVTVYGRIRALCLT